MARSHTIVLIAIAVLAASCTHDRNPITVLPPGSATLASATVGPDGGDLRSDGFVLSVPPGAFGAAADLKLYADTGADSVACTPVSSRYRLEGLPVDFAAPLAVRLRRTADPADGALIVLGVDAFSPSQGQKLTAWSVVDAADSSGWIQGRIETGVPPGGKRGSLDRPIAAVRLLASRIDREHTTPAGHFRLWTPLTTLTAEQLAGLGANLEEAYDRHQQLGFRYEARTRWPVSVSVVNLAPTVDGYYSASILGVNYGTLEFNALRMDNVAEMRVTAAHEFLHMVQGLYDPRSGWDQASGGGPQYWLDEATSVWCESGFHADPGYCSSVRQNNELTPLGGLTAGLRVGDAFHGYGLSSMIRFLTQRGDSAFVSQAYRAIQGGVNPVEAVRGNLRTPRKSWWWEYLHDLVRGRVYRDVTPGIVERERAGMFRITSADDTLHTFQAQLPDLSGMIYLVRLDDPQIDSSSILDVHITGGECSISAFSMPDASALVPLGQAADSLRVTGLRQLTEQGSKLIILVSNRRDSSAGYTGTSPVTLKLRVVRGIDLSRFHFGWLTLTYHAFWGGDGRNPWDVPRQDLNFFSVPPGRFVGSTYSVAWDSTETGTGTRYKGHFRVVLNPATLQVQSWSAESRWIFSGPGSENVYICEGGALNLTRQSSTELAWELSGAATCAPLTKVYVRQTSEGRVASDLLRHECNAQSSFELKLMDPNR
jgi:hypothetical protein